MKRVDETQQRPLFIQQFRRQLLLAITLLFLTVVCTGIAGVYSVNYQYSIDEIRDTLQEKVDTLLRSMIDQETGLRGYIMTNDASFLDQFYQGRAEFLTTKETLQRRLNAIDLLRNARDPFTTAIRNAEIWYSSYAFIQLHLRQKDAYTHPFSEQSIQTDKALFDRFRQSINRLQSTIKVDLAALRDLVKSLNSYTLGISLVLALLVMLFMWRTLHKSFHMLAKQFVLLRTTAQHLIQGEYQARIVPLQHEELHQIGQTFNHMIDTLQQREVELREAEHNYRTLIDAMPQMVWVYNAAGTAVEYYNKQCSTYTGVVETENTPILWAKAIHPDDLANRIGVWERARQAGTDYEIKYRVKRASDNTYRWHLMRGIPQRDSSGKIYRWIGTGTDIDDIKHIEEALIQANQAQHNFVSTVSHEFRTTLTGIQGFSELLSKQNFSPAEVKDYASDIYTDATRLNRMISDLLDLEKMYSGKMTLNQEELDVAKILLDVSERMRPIALNHTIETSINPHIPYMQADSDKLIQVIYNLLSNAIKYSPEGGTIRVQAEQEGQQLHVRVQDQGIGIPAEALEKIFQPYNRVHAEHTRYIKGTGLGLPIVRQIVEMHGGRVWVESFVGEGSTFHFTLPLQQHPEAVAHASSVYRINAR